MAVLLTPPVLQFFDDDGNPLSGGKLYTYAAGTTNPKATYTDASGATPATNPIVLDAAGRAVVWILGSYKVELRDADNNVIRVTDNVTSFNSQPSAGESYFEALSGDGVQAAFTLSQNLGNDENSVFVFINNGLTEYSANGSFASDTAWTKGSGWTIGSGVATATGAISTSISQNAAKTLIAGQAYITTYTITRSAGSITPNVGGAAGTVRSAAGTYSEIIIAGATQLIEFSTSGFTGTLDNVSIHPVMSAGNQLVPPTAFTLNGTTIIFADVPSQGINNILIFAPALLVNAAANSAALAEQFKDAAELAKDGAETAEDNAADSADEAESWAIGDLVARPEGSAKVWAESASKITIPNGTVANAKLSNMPAGTIKANTGTLAAAPSDAPLQGVLALQYLISGPADTTTDYNTINKEGVFQSIIGLNNTNGPGGAIATYGYLTVYKSGANLTQVLYPYSTANLARSAYIRTLYGGAWSSWNRVLTDQATGLTHACKVSGISAGASSGTVGATWKKLVWNSIGFDSFPYFIGATKCVVNTGGVPNGNFVLQRDGVYNFAAQVYVSPPASGANVSLYLGLTDRGTDGSGSTVLHVSNGNITGGMHPSVSMNVDISHVGTRYYSFDWYYLDGASIAATLSLQTSSMYCWASVKGVR